MAILPGTRIRDNGVFGTITDNPLTAGAVTFNSAELSDLSVVAGNHALVTLDPLKEHGAPEIVMVTAHTAAATVATIQRGMFGTTARSHPQGSLWVHAACDNDFIEVLTSGTRPTDQYEGQFIYETDTNKLIGFGGVDWAPRDAGGTLGYAQVVASQGSITGVTPLTGLSVVATISTGRRIRVTGQVRGWNSTIADDRVIFSVQEDGIDVNGIIMPTDAAAGSSTGGGNVSAIITPAAGGHTYRLTAQALDGGTVVMVAIVTAPAFILVEDIGAA